MLAFSASPAAAATAFSQALLVRGDDTTLLSESPISSWGFDGGSTGLHGYGGGRFVTADSGHFTKPIGKDSLELTAAVVKGTHFKQLSFEATKTGSSSAYFRVCFTDVMLSSSQLGFGSGDRAEERIGFSYDKAKYDYAPAGALAGGCGGKSPALNAWVIKLGGHKATVGASCLTELCKATIRLTSGPGQCLTAKRGAGGGCAPVGTASATINGGTAEVLRMPLEVSKARLLGAESVQLIGLLKGGGRKVLDNDALTVPAVQTPGEVTLGCPGVGRVGSPLEFTGGVKKSKRPRPVGHSRATLVPAGGAPVAIELTAPDGSLAGAVAVTDAAGAYAYGDFAPDLVGRWSVVASSPAGQRTGVGQSQACAVEVGRRASSLTLSCPTGTIPFVPPTLFAGALTPAGTGSVEIVYSTTAPPATTITHTVPLAADRTYSDSFSPGVAGSWTAVAHYLGDGSVAPTDSPTCTFMAG